MAPTTHLNSLQALEMAIREGSLQRAAERLGITPAAVGQRIRALEKFLDTDLILRGRSGLRPTPALEGALDDLHAAFAALDRVASSLEFQRTAEIHVVADTDWAELWLLRRLDVFRADHPNIHFNINGEGDVPMRLGAADIYVDRDPAGPAADGDELYAERFLPVGSPEIADRVSNPFATKAADTAPQYLPVGQLDDQTWRHTRIGSLEGFPLLHLQRRQAPSMSPGWVDWLAAYPYERTEPQRGVRYAHVRNALDGVRSGAGLLVCGLSFLLDDLDAGLVSLPFPASESLVAEHPFRFKCRQGQTMRPQLERFVAWLRAEAAMTRVRMDALAAG